MNLQFIISHLNLILNLFPLNLIQAHEQISLSSLSKILDPLPFSEMKPLLLLKIQCPFQWPIAFARIH